MSLKERLNVARADYKKAYFKAWDKKGRQWMRDNHIKHYYVPLQAAGGGGGGGIFGEIFPVLAVSGRRPSITQADIDEWVENDGILERALSSDEDRPDDQQMTDIPDGRPNNLDIGDISTPVRRQRTPEEIQNANLDDAKEHGHNYIIDKTIGTPSSRTKLRLKFKGTVIDSNKVRNLVLNLLSDGAGLSIKNNKVFRGKTSEETKTRWAANNTMVNDIIGIFNDEGINLGEYMDTPSLAKARLRRAVLDIAGGSFHHRTLFMNRILDSINNGGSKPIYKTANILDLIENIPAIEFGEPVPGSNLDEADIMARFEDVGVDLSVASDIFRILVSDALNESAIIFGDTGNLDAARKQARENLVASINERLKPIINTLKRGHNNMKEIGAIILDIINSIPNIAQRSRTIITDTVKKVLLSAVRGEPLALTSQFFTVESESDSDDFDLDPVTEPSDDDLDLGDLGFNEPEIQLPTMIDRIRASAAEIRARYQRIFRGARIQRAPPDPDDPGGDPVAVISVAGRRIRANYKNILALMIALGATAFSAKKIVDAVKEGKTVKIDPTNKDKTDEKDDDTTIPNNIPTPMPHTDFPSTGRIVDAINALPADQRGPMEQLLRDSEKQQIIELGAKHDDSTIPNAPILGPINAHLMGPNQPAIEMTQRIKDLGFEDEVIAYNAEMVKYRRNFTDNHLTPPNSVKEDLIAKQKDLGERMQAAFISIAPISRKNEIAARTNLEDSRRAFVNSQAEFSETWAQLQALVASGASPAMIENLHVRLEDLRATMNKAQLNKEYADNVVRYKSSLNNRTFLVAGEVYPRPDNLTDIKTFNRIQQLEASLEGLEVADGPAYVHYVNAVSQTLNRSDFDSDQAYYQRRLEMLAKVYEDAGMDLPPPITIDAPVNVGDDPDSMVSFADYDKSIDEGEGLARAEVVDPAEASLFLSTNKQARDQQQVFDSFSRVQPGHGLGNPRTNPVMKHNIRADMLRFKNNPKGNLPYMVPTMATMEQRAPQRTQPMLVPVLQNEFGSIQFEDDYENSVMSNHLTYERQRTNNWDEWDNSHSIYHPELALSRYRARPTIIPELRMSGYNFGLGARGQPSKLPTSAYTDRVTGYNFNGGTMTNDNFDHKPTKTPQFNSARLSGSSRMR